jgi:hypothetical protein
MTDNDWRARVLVEHTDLQIKVGRLEVFRSTQAYRDLPRDERDRLTAQLMFMRGYLAMLKARIDGFQ